ncbi:MAG: hypothetical protein HOW97_03005 [Catenulispora sp.]|nr:hypothetical protein [Catenulispora sp.]
MPLTLARFTHHVEQLHNAAQTAHREIGIAQPVLMLLPDTGQPVRIVLPFGTPQTSAGRAELKRRAREIGTRAAALTGESWVIVPSIRAEQLPNMPLADIPRPAEADPEARREAVATSAWWPTAPDGPLSVQRVTFIDRTAFGPVFTDSPYDQMVHSPGGGGIAAFLVDLLT